MNTRKTNEVVRRDKSAINTPKEDSLPMNFKNLELVSKTLNRVQNKSKNVQESITAQNSKIKHGETDFFKEPYTNNIPITKKASLNIEKSKNNFKSTLAVNQNSLVSPKVGFSEFGDKQTLDTMNFKIQNLNIDDCEPSFRSKPKRKKQKLNQSSTDSNLNQSSFQKNQAMVREKTPAKQYKSDSWPKKPLSVIPSNKNMTSEKSLENSHILILSKSILPAESLSNQFNNNKQNVNCLLQNNNNQMILSKTCQPCFSKNTNNNQDREKTPAQKKEISGSVLVTNSLDSSHFEFIKALEKSQAEPRSKTPNKDSVKTQGVVEMINASVTKIPPVSKAKIEYSNKGTFFVVSSNTNQGKVRDYNEDRVSVHIEMSNSQKGKPKLFSNPINDLISMFSVFDGHGSSECSQFLSEKLHTFVLDRLNYDCSKLESQIKTIYEDFDAFMKSKAKKPRGNFSGSCACTILVTNRMIYGINSGDSRCIVSGNDGKVLLQLTDDQKPTKLEEYNRVVEAGGTIYRTVWNEKAKFQYDQKANNHDEIKVAETDDKLHRELTFGPWRIAPGQLSVTRCFGDFECKTDSSGNSNNILIVEPMLSSFSQEDADFLVIGCHLIS